MKIMKNMMAPLMGIISALLIVFTQVSGPNDPEYAGSVFSWNLYVFFPLLILSLIFSLISGICLITYWNHNKDRSYILITLSLVANIPCAAITVLVFWNIVSISLSCI